jgi:hypothetical protein
MNRTPHLLGSHPLQGAHLGSDLQVARLYGLRGAGDRQRGGEGEGSLEEGRAGGVQARVEGGAQSPATLKLWHTEGGHRASPGLGRQPTGCRTAQPQAHGPKKGKQVLAVLQLENFIKPR